MTIKMHRWLDGHQLWHSACKGHVWKGEVFVTKKNVLSQEHCCQCRFVRCDNNMRPMSHAAVQPQGGSHGVLTAAGLGPVGVALCVRASVLASLPLRN